MGFFPRRVLLAADRSAESRLALEAAVQISEDTGSELHVMYVGLISTWVQPNTLSPNQYDRLRTEAREVLDEQVREVEKLGGTVTESYLRMGKVDSEVIRLAEKIQTEMIVVGSRGQHTVSRVLLGNNAESIVRYAPCPVLVMRKTD